MKRFIFFKVMTAVLLVVGAASCSSTEEGEATLDVSKTALSFTPSVRSQTFDIASNTSWTVTAPDWVTCAPASGSGNATVKVTSDDASAAALTGELKVNGGGIERTIALSQQGEDFSVSSYTIEFGPEGEPQTVTVTSNWDWTIDVPAAASWCTVTPLKGGPGETEVTLEPKPITDRTPRSQQLLTINYNGTFSMLSVSQTMPNEAPAAPELLSPAPDEGDIAINAEFTWRAAVDPDGDELTYRLMVSKDNGTTWDTSTTSSTTGRLATLLTKNTPYLWKVEASDPFGGTAESTAQAFTTGTGGIYANGEVVLWQTESAGAPAPVHLVFMGDGYIEDDYVEGGAFDQAVNKAIEGLFAVEPFTTYRDFFRISSVAVYSDQRGATVLKDMAGCRAQTRNTAFSSKLEGGGSTGIGCDYDKVFSYAKRVPGVDDAVLENTTVFLIINLDVYAGTCSMYYTGRSVSMCPTGSDSFEAIVTHEGGGHGFGRLLDEYRYDSGPLPQQEKDQIKGWRAADAYYANNISLTNDPAAVHWKHYLGRTGYEAVGFYEGACLYSREVWRSEYISCMEDNRAYFNAPSREAIVRRIRRASGTEFDINDFMAKDKIRSDNTTRPMSLSPAFVPLAPPILND